MNIFILSKDTTECAKMHCDKHVIKMLLETTQLLCSAYYYTGQSEISPYKLTHKNHPCSIWTRKTLNNWMWLYSLGIELYKEYQFRFGYNKIHKSGEVLCNLKTPNLKASVITDPPQVMDDNFKNKDVVVAYRNYYIFKSKIMNFSYTNRHIPSWIKLL